MTCPTTETLEQLALGFLEDAEPVRKHAAGCAACASRLKLLAGEHAALGAAAKAVRLPQIPRPRSRLRWALALSGVAAGILIVVTMATYNTTETVAFPQEGFTAGARMKGWDESLERANADKSPRVEAYDLEKESRERETALAVEKRLSFQTRRPSPAPAPEMAPPPPLTVLPPPPPPKPEPPKPRPAPVPAEPAPAPPREDPSVMIFKDAGINPAIDTSKETLSTFALDVDTASYTLIRNYLSRGALPPKEAVRVEECINYFRTLDPAPETGTFAIRLEAAPSPFDPERHLLRIGIKAREIKDGDRKDVVLTFVIDVSGSMQQENRLELVKLSLRELVTRLRPSDRIGIVVYGDNARDVLPSTPVAEKARILDAIQALRSEGSTNVEDGIRRGYGLATRAFEGKKTNRVVLCSDGVANNGVTDPELLLKQVKDKAAEGIFLSTLGFGMGNYNDHLMERLANGGNGNYAYIDDLKEAKKIFSEKLVGMMEVVAQDAKLQVEFDPGTVASFRLLGYENRHVANRDFRNDQVDAGEVGAGHSVTAVYELQLKPDTLGRLATVRIRYKDLALKEVVESQESLGRAQVKALAADGSASWRMAATAAMFAEILRESPRAKGVGWDRVLAEAERAARDLDRPEDAVEFVELVKKAATRAAK
jgi:Ca-activated chloride channel family protein